MKQFTLIIVTYNSEKDIYDCLKSVYQYNDIGDALEVIVVDNNSKNYVGMRNKLSMLYPQVSVISNTANGGYGQGNNLGIKSATAPIVAIMNPDVRLTMPTFRTMLNTFTNSNVIMCVGKQYINTRKEGTSYFCDYHSSPFYQSLIYSFYKRYDIYKSKTMWLSGAFFAIRKVDFENIGLFDEDLFMYGEEYDIHLRIQKHFPNKSIQYLKKTKYLHLIGERIPSEDAYYKSYSSIYQVCKKHHIAPKKVFNHQIITLKIQYVMSKVLQLIGRPFDHNARKRINMLDAIFKRILDNHF